MGLGEVPLVGGPLQGSAAAQRYVPWGKATAWGRGMGEMGPWQQLSLPPPLLTAAEQQRQLES